MPNRFRVFRGKASKPNPEARCICRPSRWGNPFLVKERGQEKAVKMYRDALLAGRLPYTCNDVRKHLHGRDLGCYCGSHEACHADVLLEIANQ